MDIQAILHSRKMSSLLKKMQKGVDVSSFTVPISRCSIVNEIINICRCSEFLHQYWKHQGYHPLHRESNQSADRS